MGFIKEPEGVDFIIESRPLTKKEELALSKFIKADKQKRATAEKRKKKRYVRSKSVRKTSKTK